jgi:hypothetical protein
MRERQRYFDSDFNAKVGATVRGLSREAKRILLIGYVIVSAYSAVVTGSLAIALALLVVIGFALFASRTQEDPSLGPSGNDAPVLPARDDDERAEYLASGAGEVAYETARSTLRALVGDEVAIVVMSTDGEPAVTLHGRLGSPTNVSEDTNEHLLFHVGTAGGFYVPRLRFMEGEASLERNDIDGGLRLVVGDMVVWIFEPTPA